MCRFAIEIEKCDGRVKVIACIEESKVIPDTSDRSILKHLGLDRAAEPRNRSPPTHSSGLFNLV
jgi:hypothetical protein